MTTRAKRAAVVATAALMVFLASCGGGSSNNKKQAADTRPELTLMTRNLYLGADLEPLFKATPAELGTAATAAYDQMIASDVPARLERVAGEVVNAKPDVIALQEASTWNVQAPGAAAPAPLYDFVALLTKDLEAKGARYTVASTVDGFSGGLPVPNVGLVTMQDRDVVLVRDGSGVQVSNPSSGTYNAKMSVAVAGIPIQIVRGWASVDATVGGRSVRIIGTHLEAFDDPVRDQQQQELMAVVGASTLPTVLLGDLNSAAGGADDSTYQATLHAGFTDTWTAAEQPSALTCCRAADLRSGNYTERIDFVLAKGALHADRTTVIGDEASSRTDSGRWSSDHAGVVTTVRVG